MCRRPILVGIIERLSKSVAGLWIWATARAKGHLYSLSIKTYANLAPDLENKPMRVSFSTFARALIILPLLFIPAAFSQTDDCRITGGGSLCINSALNYSECDSMGFCGSNCPSPPAPGPQWGNLMWVSVSKPPQCLEDAACVASAGKGYYDMFGSRYAEGLYSYVPFVSGTLFRYCDFSVTETGGFIGCSSCRTYGDLSNKHCIHTAQHPAPCYTEANCIPNVCPRTMVSIAAAINNPCLDPRVRCTTQTDADSLGVFGNAGCQLLGYTFLYGWGYSDCDGSFRADSSTAPCPTY